jgi:hypothetical protein
MSKLARDDNGQVTQIYQLGTTQVMTVTGSSVQSNAIASDCTIIRLATSSGAHCHFQIGSNPTASLTTSPMLPPNSVGYFKVTGGDKVAVIRGSTAVDISISQVL